jgi:hypothetical protein
MKTTTKKAPARKSAIAKKRLASNSRHLRLIEVEKDDEEGYPQRSELTSGELLAEKRDALKMSHADLLEAINRHPSIKAGGVEIESNARCNWYAGVIPPERFGIVSEALYGKDRHAARRLHLDLLRTVMPEGSLSLFDELVSNERRLLELRWKEAMRQKAKRARR